LILSIASAIFAYVPPLRVPQTPHHDTLSTQHRYIIKLKDHADQAHVSSFLGKKAASATNAQIATISSAHGTAPDDTLYGVQHKFQKSFYNGMSAVLTPEHLRDLKEAHGESIEYIEPDSLAYATAVQSNPPSWGQIRVGQWENMLNDKKYVFPNQAGAGVDVYVLDTGVRTSHSSFEGRAKMVKNFVREEGPQDNNGHGTHVAGTIASARYGVAKRANILGIKVLNAKGSGLYSRIISAIDYVVKHGRRGKSVVNLSLAGAYSKALNDVMRAARQHGVVVVVAAGNEHQNACKLSPASSVHVVTVGATDMSDRAAVFSNWGKCVDVYGPGVDIVSLGIQRNDGSAVMSGTSMASPHVAGVVALFMSLKKYSSADSVVRDVLGWSHLVVKGAASGSGMGLVYANPRLSQ